MLPDGRLVVGDQTIGIITDPLLKAELNRRATNPGVVTVPQGRPARNKVPPEPEPHPTTGPPPPTGGRGRAMLTVATVIVCVSALIAAGATLGTILILGLLAHG